MKTLYLDCQMGASGDMIAGALLELAGDRERTLAELNAIGVPGVVFEARTLSKCGIAATHLSVLVNGREEGAACEGHHHSHDHGAHRHEHRTLADMLAIVDALSLPTGVARRVREVYSLLAKAESLAHGRDVGEIHFHEVGAMDAVADIVAACWLLDRMGADEVVASPVNVGSGTVVCAHGELPVPAPATAILLEGVPTYSDGVIRGELTTPTGAALLKSFVSRFAPQPPMVVEAIGCGAGTRDFPRANFVRALLGASCEDSAGSVLELRFNVDDMTGEELAFASERIFKAGALDVSFAGVLMKKGRPGHVVCVICSPADRDAVVRAIFANTSTLGVREFLCRRYEMERTVERVRLADGTEVRCKVASGYGVSRTKWEADDVAAYAAKNAVSLSEALRRIEGASACSTSAPGSRSPRSRSKIPWSDVVCLRG